MPYRLKTLGQYAGHTEQYDAARGSANERGYDRRWQGIRLNYLKHNPLCAECSKKGIIKIASEVHHIKPLADGGSHDTDNLMSVCHKCHSKIGKEK